MKSAVLSVIVYVYRGMKKNWIFSDYTIGALLTILVVGCFYVQVPFLERMELMFYDVRARFRAKPDPSRKGDEVTIVAIDENSLADSDLGKWPWPRAHIARLIDKISEGEPKVMAMSILFSEPDENQGLREIQNLQGIYATMLLQRESGKVYGPRPLHKRLKEEDYHFLAELSSAEVRLDNDLRLAQSLESSGKVLMALSFDLSGTPTEDTIKDEEMPAAFSLSEIKGIENKNDETVFPPVEATGVGLPLEDFAFHTLGAGHVTVAPGRDGILRREIPVIKFLGRYFPSFSLAAVRAYLGVPPDQVKVFWGKNIQIGKTFVPLDSENRMAISYLEHGTSFKYYSVSDIMKGKENPKVFKDKIVLIGFAASGFGNPFSTPLGSSRTKSSSKAFSKETCPRTISSNSLTPSDGVLNRTTLFLPSDSNCLRWVSVRLRHRPSYLGGRLASMARVRMASSSSGVQ